MYKSQLLNFYQKKSAYLKQSKFHLKHLIIFVIVLAVLLPSWQFVFPEYSLGAADPGLPGNHVSLDGPYYPNYAPSSFLNMYGNLSGRTNLTYSVYSNDMWYIPEKWDSGILSITPPGVTPAAGFSSLFLEIFNDNISSDVIPLSEIYGVKYFFIDNSTIQNNSPMIKFLDRSGLSIYYTNTNLTVFESPLASNIVPSSFLLGYSLVSNLSLLELYSALTTHSIYPSLINAPEQLNLELSNSTNNTTIALIDYQDFLGQEHGIPTFFGQLLNGFSNASFIDLYNGWNIFNPGMDYYAKYNINNSHFNVTPETSNGAAATGTVHVLYQSPMFDGTMDIPIPDYNNTIVSISGTIKYSVTGSNNGISLDFPANNGTLMNNAGATIYLPSGVNMTSKFATILPKDSRTFTVALSVASLNGTLSVSNLKLNYTFTYKGSTYINKTSGIHVNFSPGSYDVMLNGLNKELKTESFNSEITISKNSSLNLAESNLSYLTYALIIPSYLESASGIPVITGLNYDNLSASLSFYSENSTRYVSISYDPSYKWSVSNNLKYIGTNSMGVQIYKIEYPGNTKLYISDAYPLFLAEIMAAITIDGILPLIIFIIYPAFKKRYKKI